MKTQYRFTKEANKVLSQKVSIPSDLNMYDIVDAISFDDTVPVVKILDQNCEDWDITEELFRYFAVEILKWDDDSEDIKPKTKEFIQNLYKKYCHEKG